MEKEKLKKNNFLIIFVLILLLVLGYLGFVISKLNNQNHQMSKDLSILVEENKEMNMILLNEETLSGSKNNSLKSNLMLMLSSYDSLENSNSIAIDSINKQRNKIKSLLSKVDALNRKSTKDWRKIYKLKKEAETLRGIMKGYIHTIDSLNTLNINLSNTLTEKTNTLNKVNNQNKQFKEENKKLQEKVTMGGVLQAANIKVNAIRIRNSGAQSETTRASRSDMIKVCCTLLENKLTKKGDKNIYLRILDNSRKVFSSEKSIIIKSFEKNEIEMSSNRTINYQNQSTDVCIYYDLLTEILAGEYSVELYSEGFLIGKSSFSLR